MRQVWKYIYDEGIRTYTPPDSEPSEINKTRKWPQSLPESNKIRKMFQFSRERTSKEHLKPSLLLTFERDQAFFTEISEVRIAQEPTRARSPKQGSRNIQFLGEHEWEANDAVAEDARHRRSSRRRFQLATRAVNKGNGVSLMSAFGDGGEA